jgi:hypothetical protein
MKLIGVMKGQTVGERCSQHSARKVPLHDSTNALSGGLPEREVDLYSILIRPQIQARSRYRRRAISVSRACFAPIPSISSGFGSMVIRCRLSIDDLARNHQLNMGP